MFIPGIIIGSLPENLREKFEVILAEKGSLSQVLVVASLKALRNMYYGMAGAWESDKRQS